MARLLKKQAVQTLYGLSNQIVPRACFPDGILDLRRGSVFPIARGYKLIDKPVQSLYGLVLQSRPHFDGKGTKNKCSKKD